jgi:hypothetical protein
MPRNLGWLSIWTNAPDAAVAWWLAWLKIMYLSGKTSQTNY